MTILEDEIRRKKREEELPTKSELPNLEVIIIKTPGEANDLAQSLF